MHLDSGNRGCEAIARGSIEILGLDKANYIGLVSDIKADTQTGLIDCATLIRAKRYMDLNKLQKLAYKIIYKSIPTTQMKYRFSYAFRYNRFLNRTDDITLITGGDMLCYGNNEVNYINDYLTKRKIKTVLWGCSIGRENLTPEKIATLNNFDAITARESLTHEMLLSLGLDNVFCYPDPAFVLQPEKVGLPKCFDSGKKIVGVNLSNFVEKEVGCDTLIGKNITNLVQSILDFTEMDILLIPHVFWKDQDDRIICSQIYEKYKSTGRVFMLNSEKLNYCQIRYIISKCGFFVGARTHAMISAYAMQVPALALGYSVKSIGIAQDVGIPLKYVVDCNNLKSEYEYKNAFLDMIENTRIFMDAYKEMPAYIHKAYDAKTVIDGLSHSR